jgi:hypothetical protein
VYENRKNEGHTSYGGILNVRRVWNWLGLDELFLTSGFVKRSGISAITLAFVYVLFGLVNAKSISDLIQRVKGD